MPSKTQWVWLLLIAFVYFGYTAGAQDASRKKAAPKIGVINITKVFDNYKKKRVLEEDLRAIREQKSRVLREKENEIKRLADEIRMLELGSEARKKRETEFEKKQVELRSFTEVSAGNLTTQKRDVTEKLYSDIADAVSEYGRKHGFDLIIKWEDVEMRSETMEELLYKINQKTVLFASEKIDITQELIHILNAGYSKEIVEK